MRTFLSIFFFAFIILTTIQEANADTCVWQPSTHVYNFTTTRRSYSNYQYFDTEEDILFELNLCGSLNSIDNTLCPCCDTTSAPYTGYTMDTGQQCTSWGMSNNTEGWQYIDDDLPGVGVILSYYILTSLGHVQRSMSYNMFCNDNEFFQIISAFIYDTMPPHIHVNVATMYACLEPTPSPEPSPTPAPTFCKTFIGNELFDLSDLSKEWYYYDPWNNGQYYLYICGNVGSDTNCTCCVSNTSTGWLLDDTNSCSMLGYLNTSTWGYLQGSENPEDGISLTYRKTTSLGHVSHTLRWDFVCDSDASTGEIIDVEEYSILPGLTEVTFVSNRACPLDPFSPTPVPTPCPSWVPCPDISCSPIPTTASSSSTTGMKGGYVFLVVCMAGAATFIGGWFVHKYRNDRNQYANL